MHYHGMFAVAETDEIARNCSDGDAAFDAWLHASLQRTYGVAGAEPLPEALLRLCEALPGDRAGSP